MVTKGRRSSTWSMTAHGATFELGMYSVNPCHVAFLFFVNYKSLWKFTLLLCHILNHGTAYDHLYYARGHILTSLQNPVDSCI